MRTFLITVQTSTQLANLIHKVDGPLNTAVLDEIKAGAMLSLDASHVVITFMMELEEA